jgi:hypothetical protein
MLLCARRSVKMMARSGATAYVAGAANLIVGDRSFRSQIVPNGFWVH